MLYQIKIKGIEDTIKTYINFTVRPELVEG